MSASCMENGDICYLKCPDCNAHMMKKKGLELPKSVFVVTKQQVFHQKLFMSFFDQFPFLCLLIHSFIHCSHPVQGVTQAYTSVQIASISFSRSTSGKVFIGFPRLSKGNIEQK